MSISAPIYFHRFSGVVRVPKVYYLHTFTSSSFEMLISALFYFYRFSSVVRVSKAYFYAHFPFLTSGHIVSCADLVFINSQVVSELPKYNINTHLHSLQWPYCILRQFVCHRFSGAVRMPKLIIYTHLIFFQWPYCMLRRFVCHRVSRAVRVPKA